MSAGDRAPWPPRSTIEIPRTVSTAIRSGIVSPTSSCCATKAPLERVRLVGEVRPPQTRHEVEDAVVSDVEAAKTHQSTSELRNKERWRLGVPLASRPYEVWSTGSPRSSPPRSKVLRNPESTGNVVPTAAQPKTSTRRSGDVRFA